MDQSRKRMNKGRARKSNQNVSHKCKMSAFIVNCCYSSLFAMCVCALEMRFRSIISVIENEKLHLE